MAESSPSDRRRFDPVINQLQASLLNVILLRWLNVCDRLRSIDLEDGGLMMSRQEAVTEQSNASVRSDCSAA